MAEKVLNLGVSQFIPFFDSRLSSKFHAVKFYLFLAACVHRRLVKIAFLLATLRNVITNAESYMVKTRLRII